MKEAWIDVTNTRKWKVKDIAYTYRLKDFRRYNIIVKSCFIFITTKKENKLASIINSEFSMGFNDML